MGRRIPKEIKEESLAKVKAGERVVDVAQQYAISSKTIYGWLRQDTGECGVRVAVQQTQARKRRIETVDR